MGLKTRSGKNNRGVTAGLLLGALVILTAVMLSGCAGSTSAAATPAAAQATEVPGKTAVLKGDYQEVAIDLGARSYEPITVQKGVPVRFVINAEASALNGCNNAVVIPAFNLKQKLTEGENLIEFTPQEVGVLPYSCWMGMIDSTITVVDQLPGAAAAPAVAEPPAQSAEVPVPATAQPVLDDC